MPFRGKWLMFLLIRFGGKFLLVCCETEKADNMLMLTAARLQLNGRVGTLSIPVFYLKELFVVFVK